MQELRRVKEKLEEIEQSNDRRRMKRLAGDALADIEALEDPYTRRVREFHEALEDSGGGDYLTVLVDAFDIDDLPVPAETPQEARMMLAEVKAERNRLFWSSFLAEEAGEVASCLNDGEPPEDFEEEVADVNILTHAIADAFGFDMLQAFHEKMDENDEKPKKPEGTGKLPAEGRDEWRGR